MEKLVLSVEQMQELIALGIDTSNASMYYCGGSSANNKLLPKTGKGKLHPGSIPTFTLQDILKILPKKIDGGGWVLSERYSEIPGEEDGAYIWYGKNEIGITNGYTPLDAAYRMLKWCIKNKYL